MKRILLSAVALVTCASAADAAMRLSTNGMGQVLLFPYYTVQGGQSTLITLVNTTDRVKAMDVRFVDAFNGREVSSGIVFLGPHDTWTGAAFAIDRNGPANFLTDDHSCKLWASFDPQLLPDGRRYDPFYKFNYTGANTDRGPQGGNRSREGSIEVVERGEAKRGGAVETALVSAAGTPDCSVIEHHDPFDAFDAPGGGVYGSFAIVDAAQGTVMAGQPTAIDGFSARPLFFATGEQRVLDLGSTSTNPLDPVEALVPVGNKLVSVKYPPNRAIDAVTAVLMTDTLYGDFTRDPAAGADTDWVISSPTKKYYADTSGYQFPEPSAAQPPYRQRYSERWPGYSCMPYEAGLYDREQRAVLLTSEVIGVPPPYFRPAGNLCMTVDVLRFSTAGKPQPADEDPLLPNVGNPVSPAVDSRVSVSAALIDELSVSDRVYSGAARLSLATGMQPAFLPAGVSGPALRGLPVIGFEATKYATGSIGDILANYTYAVPLHGRAACANAQGTAIECP